MYSNIRLMPESEVCFDSKRNCWTFQLLCTYNDEEAYVKAAYYGGISFKFSSRTYANKGKVLKQKGLKELVLTDQTSSNLLQKINDLEKEMKDMIDFEHVQLWEKFSYPDKEDKYVISVLFKDFCMKQKGFYIDECLNFIPLDDNQPKQLNYELKYFMALQKEINNQEISFIRPPRTCILSSSDDSEIDSSFLRLVTFTMGVSYIISFYPTFIEDVVEKVIQHPALRVKLLTI
jgi:hypothetical protein